jgi:lysophospholipase L1-like esterase
VAVAAAVVAGSLGATVPVAAAVPSAAPTERLANPVRPAVPAERLANPVRPAVPAERLANPVRPAVPAAAEAAAPVLRYAALGDSYSSGEGNPPFDPASGNCHRGAAAWPRVVSRQEQRIVLSAHIACSGATSKALRRRYNEEPAQLRQLRRVPGHVDVTTITIGGNDIGFARVLADCFLSDCVLDGALARTRSRIHKQLPPALARDYRGVVAADPQSAVVVVGYPRLFPTRQSQKVGCRWLSRRERVTLNRLAVLLDRTIARSARRAGMRYVSVLRALNGHELCTRRSWVYPIGPRGGQLRGHPLVPGQNAIAAIVRPRLAALR